MSYVGYSYEIADRWDSHKWDLSNLFMGLQRAVCNILYTNHKFVVVLLTAFEESSRAKIILCASAKSYFQSGFGYNVAGAGEMNDSVASVSMETWIKTWDWMFDHTPRIANLKLRTKRRTFLGDIVEARMGAIQNRINEYL
jgi:hypothetical protein